MNTRAEQLVATRRNLPAFGTDWTGITGFLAMVQRAVESADWFGKRGHFVCGGGYHAQESLMRLLTYCAVTGSQTTEEIAAKLDSDRAAKLLSPGGLPDATTLLRFAEVQPDALRHCVKEFWKLSSLLHFGQRRTPQAPADDCVAARFDRWLDPVHTPDAEADEFRVAVLVEFASKMP